MADVRVKLPESALEWLTIRWWQRALMLLFWPLMFVGTAYVGLFFFLNSHACERLVEAQLDATMAGDWTIGDIEVSPSLLDLNVDTVDLHTPRGEHVFRAQGVSTPIPWESGYALVERNHLDLKNIRIERAEVLLDFRADGPFNLLRAVSPAAPASDDAEEGDFSIALTNIDVRNADVDLLFRGFAIDLDDALITAFDLSLIGGELKMQSKPDPLAGSRIQVARGSIELEDRLMAFPLGAYGDPDQGIIEDGGTGVGGAVGRMTTLAARGLHQSCARGAGRSGIESARCASDVPEARGHLLVEVIDADVSNFWWRGMTYGFTDFTATLVERSGEDVQAVGDIALDQPWMNVSPTADDIAAAIEESGFKEPETRPEETLLYSASAVVQLQGDARILRWLFGRVVEVHAPLFVAAEVIGDLNHPEGLVQLITDHLAVAGVDAASVTLAATLDGQHLEIVDFIARTLTGSVEALGHYRILDGDFEVAVELGNVDGETLERVDGIDLSSLVPEEWIAYVEGRLTGGFTVSQLGRKLTLTLDEVLELKLAEGLPYNDATLITLDQKQSGQSDCPSLMKLENGVVRTGDEITLTVGNDTLVIDPGLTFWIDALEVAGLGVHLDIDELGTYASAFGIPVRTRKLQIDASVDGPLVSPTVAAQVTLRGGVFAGLVDVLSADVELELARGGRLTIEGLDAETSLGKVTLAGWVDVFRGDLTRVREDMALDVRLDATDVRLASLPHLAEMGLAGRVDAEGVHISGSTANPAVRGRIEGRDLEGFGERVQFLSAEVDADPRQIDLQNVEVSYGKARRVPGGSAHARLSLDRLQYDFVRRTFAVEALELVGLHVEDIASLKGVLPVTARLDIERTTARGDLDAILGGRVDQDSYLDGQLRVSEILLGERKLGSVSVRLATPSTRVVQLEGKIHPYTRSESVAPWPLDITARADGSEVSLALVFDSFRVFDLVPELDRMLNGDDPRGGRAVSKLELGGRVDATWSPRDGAAATLTLDNLLVWAMRQEIANHEQIELRYVERDNEVSVERMELIHDGRSIMLHGTAGLDGELDLEVTGEVGAQLARMAGDSIAEARGSVALALNLEGDALRPNGDLDLGALQLEGFVAVRRPVNLRVRGLGDPIVVERGVMYIERDCERSGMDCFRIPLDRAFSGEALGGTFELSGEVGRRDLFMPVSAELLAQGRDLSYRLKDTLTVTFDVPELRLFVFDLADLDAFPPRLYGSVEVTEGRYYRDHLVQSEIFQSQLGALSQSNRRDERFETPIWQRFPALAAVELDVLVDSKSGFRIDNLVAGAAVDIELEFNNVRVGGTLQDIAPSGIVNIRDGDVAFRSTRFEVLPGAQLRFNRSLDAQVDVSAQAEINTQRGFAASITGGATRDRRRITTSDLASGSQLYIVTLSLTGTLSTLNWTLESNPFLSSNNIYTLILTGKTLEDLGQERDDSPAFDIAFDSLLAPFFESQVDEILSADQFKFQFAEGAAQFSYIQQVNRALRIAAGVSIRGAEGNESAIAGEYRFDDQLLLELIAQDTLEDEGKAPVFRVGTRLEWRLPLD